MKIITKKEWDKASDEYKRIYEGTPYMLFKESDGRTYFGPVKIKEGDKLVDFKKPEIFKFHENKN